MWDDIGWCAATKVVEVQNNIGWRATAKGVEVWNDKGKRWLPVFYFHEMQADYFRKERAIYLYDLQSPKFILDKSPDPLYNIYTPLGYMKEEETGCLIKKNAAAV